MKLKLWLKFFVLSLLLLSNYWVSAAELQSSYDQGIPYLKGASVKSLERFKLTVHNIETINTMGETFCDSIHNADIKLWFTVDENGEVSVIEVSEPSGIEVTFHCKQQDSDLKKINIKK
jgi:hypothetical protein